MPVESVHQEYADNEHKWQKARDILEGADTIKAAGETYLPRLTKQTDAEYNAYKDRTPFWNATGRTHSGLTGMLFRKDPTVVFKDGLGGNQKTAMESLQNDADLKNNSLEDYARSVTEEILGVGRGGTLIDWNEEENRAYFAYYATEDILNWRTQRVGGNVLPTLITLRETVSMPNETVLEVGANEDQAKGEDDPYTDNEVAQLRVLRLIMTAPTAEEDESDTEAERAKVERRYIIELWRKDNVKIGKKKTESRWVLKEIIEPTRNGRPLPEIPFVFHGAEDSDPSVDRPPLDDLAEMNLDHYRTSADYKHGMHFTALPTAWVAGFPSETELCIGSTEAWVTDNAEARAGYLEFEGKGLSEFNSYLNSLETKMAVLGARMLEQQKKEAETAEAMHVRQGGEVSVLQHIGNVLSTTLSSAMKWAYWWSGTAEHPTDVTDEEASIGLNTDFVAMKLGSQDVVNLVNAWMQKGISRDTLHWNLAQGEILPPGRTNEEEMELISLDEDLIGSEPVNQPEDGDEE